MNAQIDKDGNNKFGLHNSLNRNDEYQVEFSFKNRFSCQNTKFQKRVGKLWKYTYTKNATAQIYYIFIKKKWMNSDLKCETYSSFERVSSDHSNHLPEST